MAVYLDSSAVVKLATGEPESAALKSFLERHPERISSRLLRLEVARALLRAPWLTKPTAAWMAQILDGIIYLGIEEAILTRAASLPPSQLRTLDAIHLATALSLPELQGMVVYDRRLAAAAAEQGLQVWLPGA